MQRGVTGLLQVKKKAPLLPREPRSGSNQSERSDLEVRDDLLFAAHDAGQNNGIAGDCRTE